MKHSFRAFCTAALLLAASLAHAEIDASAAESLLRKSGMWEQLAGLGPQAEAGMQEMLAQGATAPAEAEKARVTRVIRDAFAPARLRAVSVRVVASGTRAEHLPALRKWFDSPVGQAATRLEEAASATPTDPRAMLEQGVRLLNGMPAERRALLEQMVEATDAAEAMVRITIGTALAAHRGAASVAPDAPGMSAAQLRAALEAQRPQMLKAFGAMMLASFARIYEGLPTGELQQYVDFIRTPAGTHFNDVAMDALEAAVVDATAEMGRRLPGTRDGRNS